MKVRIIAICMLVFCCSCSSSARFQMNDGSVLDGKILRSTRTEIIVEGEHAQETTVMRSDVYDIDHPGNGAILMGTVMVIYGSLFAAWGVVSFIDAAERRTLADQRGRTDFAQRMGWGLSIMGAASIAGGIPIIVNGAKIWTTSTERSERPGIDTMELSVGSGMGLSFKATF